MLFFHAEQSETVKSTKEVNAMKKQMRKFSDNSSLFLNIIDKYLDAQMMLNLINGNISRLVDNPDLYKSGIKRVKGGGHDDGGAREDMNFEV